MPFGPQTARCASDSVSERRAPAGAQQAAGEGRARHRARHSVVTAGLQIAPSKGMDVLRRTRCRVERDDARRQVEAYVAALVNSAPPLTPEQAQRLRLLLAPRRATGRSGEPLPR